MPFREQRKLDQRAEFVIRAKRRQQSFSALCAEFGISRPSGYLWLRRFESEGAVGLHERSRRPQRSPAKTSPQLEQRVVEMRQQRPDWGARKVHVLLREAHIELPVSTIHRIFVRHGLVRRLDVTPSQGIRFERDRPNQLWQMDYKGPLQGPAGELTPLSVLDDHSRYLVGLELHTSTKAEPLQRSLIKIFERSGVPEAMLMDHGSPWWNAQGSGLTWLTVWLMKQGIELHFSRFRHPQTQGKVERFHRSLKAAWRWRGPGQSVQGWLDEFRQEYNHMRPHEALGDAKPAQRWQPSGRSYVEEPPEWEYATGEEVRRLACQGHLFLNGKRYEVTRALKHERVRIERLQDKVLVFYRASLVRVIELG